MFILYAESDRLIRLIYGEGYIQAVQLQKALAITVVCSFVHNLAAYLMMSMQKERLLLAFYLAGLAFNVIICAAAIHRFPLEGAVASIVLTKGFMVLLTAGYCQRQIGLIQKETWLQTAAAVFAGTMLYALGKSWIFREAGELLALLPVLFLALKWYREKPLIAENG
jgi:O-antigen/teichoic acid export membrane protein